MKRSSLIFILVVIILYIGFWGRYEYKMPKRNFADFSVYYFTAQRLINHKDIYDRDSYCAQGLANFKYPPGVGLLFYPLGFLPKHYAAWVWFSFNFALVVLFFWICSRLLFEEGFPFKYRVWICFLSSLFCLRFFLYNFDEGQVNILMMTLVGAGLYALRRKRQFLSGLFIAYSILVKYMTILFLPYFFHRRKIISVLYIIVGLIMISIFPALLWGWDYNVLLFKKFIPYVCKTSLDWGSISTHANQSLFAMFTRFFSSFSPYKVNVLNLSQFYLGIILGASLLLLYIFPFLRSSYGGQGVFSENVDWAMLFMCVPLFNPNGWVHAFVFLLFPYMVCLYYLFKVGHVDILVWVLVVLSFLMGTWPNQLFIPSLEDSTEVYSFLCMGSLLLYLALVRIKFCPLKRDG